MAAPVPDPYLAHVSEAWNQMAAGRRPSADSVLALVGGSKQTAVGAMNFFWKSYLPDMLSGRTVDDVPDPVMQAASTLWQKARKVAEDRARKALEDDRRTLEQERASFEQDQRKAADKLHRAEVRHADALADKDRLHASEVSQLRRAHEQALVVERSRYANLEKQSDKIVRSMSTNLDELRNAAADTRQELATVKTNLEEAQQKLKESQARVAELEKDYDELLSTSERKQAAIAAFEARNTELASALEQATAAAEALESAHAEKQQQLMDQLDKMVEMAIKSVKETHEDHLRDLGTSHDKRVIELKLEHDREITALKVQIKALEGQVKQTGVQSKRSKKKVDPEIAGSAGP